MPSGSKSTTGEAARRRDGPDAPAAAARGAIRIAGSLAAAALLLAAVSALASLPAFEFGHWEKAEPIVIVVYLAGAVAAAALGTLGAADPSRLIAVLRHPFVLIPAAIALWSLAAVPTATYPMAVILGPPQSGQGTLWYLTLAALGARARMVRDDEEIWFWLAVAAIAVAASVAGLRLWAASTGAPQLLLGVGGFYAYIALALPLLAAPLRGGHRTAIAVAGTCGAAAVLAASANLSAAVAGGVGVAGCLFAWQRRPGGRPAARTWGAIAVAAAALAPYAALKWLGLAQSIPSLLSRHLTVLVVEAAEAETPVQLVVGHGLGHTPDSLFANVGVAGMKLWQAQWDFIWRDYFHSHNWLVEAVFTMGIPGAILAFAALLAPVLWGRAELRPAATGFAVAVAVVDGVWFPLGFYLPYLALAWVALSAPVAAEPGRAASAGARATIVLSSAGLVVAWLSAATVLGAFAAKVSPLKESLMAIGAPAPTVAMPKSPSGTETALAQIVQGGLESLRRLPPERRDETARAHFAWIVGNLSAAIPTTRTPALAMAGLSLFAMTDVTKELAWLSLPPAARDRLWAEWADRILRLAPGRTDVLIPYLSHLLAAGRADRASAQARTILAIRRGDPVGLYFLGAALTADPSAERKREGLLLIRQAMVAGVEQFMPIPDYLRREIDSRMPAPTGQK